MAAFLGQTKYKEYDPSNPTQTQVALGGELEKRNPEVPLEIKSFEGFSMVVYHGFKKVTYVAHIADGGYFFWITEEHAKHIGRALRSTLESLSITVTMFEGRALHVMAENVPVGVQIDELTISHKSGDEVTEEEATGLANLATKLGVKTLHLWAGDYDDGVLDKMAETFDKLGNKTLTKIDVCNVNLPEPEDEIEHDGLNLLVEKNKADY